MKSILNVKKETSNLIKGICSHKICFGIKSQPVKKAICHSVPKTFDFSQNYSVPFHRVTFDHKEIVSHQHRKMPQFHKLLQKA